MIQHFEIMFNVWELRIRISHC